MVVDEDDPDPAVTRGPLAGRAHRRTAEPDGGALAGGGVDLEVSAGVGHEAAQPRQTEVLGAAGAVLVEAGAVVDDLEQAARGVPAHGDSQGRGLRVAQRVAHRLLGHPPQQRHLGLGSVLESVDAHGRADARRAGRSQEVGERRGQALAVQVGGVDLGQQGAQRLQPVAQRRTGGIEAEAHRRRHLGVAGHGGEGERGAGEVLDDAVVQVAGDPSSLGVGGVHGRLQQTLPLTPGAAYLHGEQAQHHRGDQREQQQWAEGDPAERRRRSRYGDPPGRRVPSRPRTARARRAGSRSG